MIRLALLDDHPAVLVGLQRVIEQEPDIVIMGAASTAPGLARQLGNVRADVLVVDHDVLLNGENVPGIAGALRAETDEIAWRAQRIIGRLRPGATNRPGERESESAGGRVPDLPFR